MHVHKPVFPRDRWYCDATMPSDAMKTTLLTVVAPVYGEEEGIETVVAERVNLETAPRKEPGSDE
jgi:hypothetical protein